MGENILLINEIDKSLIGGVKIMVDGRVIDASIRSRFNRLASEIRL
ncbi:MAG: F0F1 ATP synthase subunit delta [Anaerovoracaceae bacterium]